MKRLSLKQKVRNMRIQEIRMIQRIKKNKKNKKNCRTGEEQLRTIITLPMPPFITIFLNKNRTKLLKVTNKLRDYYFRKNEQALVGSNGGELFIVPAIATNSENSINSVKSPKIIWIF